MGNEKKVPLATESPHMCFYDTITVIYDPYQLVL